MHWSPGGLRPLIKERIGARPTAASLSMPPGAMFSIMFTKHPILNYRRRQEEFSKAQRNKFETGCEGRWHRWHVNWTAISLRFFDGPKEIAAIVRAYRAAEAAPLDIGTAVSRMI